MTAITQSMGQIARPVGRAEPAPTKRVLARTAGDRGALGGDELKRLLAGDRAAWESFVQRYARVIYAAVQRRLVPAGRAHEVDDVAQDVFVKICGHDFKLLRNYDPARAKRLAAWPVDCLISDAPERIAEAFGD